MANAELALSLPAIPSDPGHGGPAHGAGGGDPVWIKVRDHTSGGVVVNVPTLLDAILTGGVIDISNCGQIGIAMQFTLGSLTSASTIIQFSDVTEVLWFQHPIINNASSALDIQSGEFKMVATNNIIYSIGNPGASRMRLLASSSGTTTSSLLGVWVARGWAVHSPMVSQA